MYRRCSRCRSGAVAPRRFINITIEQNVEDGHRHLVNEHLMHLEYFELHVVQARLVVPLAGHLLLVEALLGVPLTMIAVVNMAEVE